MPDLIGASVFGFNIAFVVAASLAVAALIITVVFVKNKPAKQDVPQEAADKGTEEADEETNEEA